MQKQSYIKTEEVLAVVQNHRGQWVILFKGGERLDNVGSEQAKELVARLNPSA